MRRSLGLICATLFIAGCAIGERLSYDEAAAWVKENDDALISIVAKLEQCSGRQNNEINRIFEDGQAFTDHCENMQKSVQKDMVSLNLAAVGYHPLREQTSLRWVEFGLYQSGISTSGTSVAVTWHVSSTECAAETISEGGYQHIRKPLFEGSCEWIYEYTSN